MATTDELNTHIQGQEYGECVFIDRFEEGVLWLSVQIQGGGARIVLPFDKAREMVAAINRVLETENASTASV